MAQGRRVRRVVRRIDTWSVLKVSALFFLTFTLVLVFACVLLWVAGSILGTVDGLERFMQAIGFEGFRFIPVQLLRGFLAAGLVVVVLGSGFSVLIAVVYNLISDLVGGIQITVLEEDTRPRPASTTAQPPNLGKPSVGTNGSTTGPAVAHGSDARNGQSSPSPSPVSTTSAPSGSPPAGPTDPARAS